MAIDQLNLRQLGLFPCWQKQQQQEQQQRLEGFSRVVEGKQRKTSSSRSKSSLRIDIVESRFVDKVMEGEKQYHEASING